MLVKEVSTYLSIEWVVRRYRPEVLIPVRHPCPVVLSQLERGTWARGWLDEMLRNDRLMADHLAPYRSLMETVMDPVEATAVLWAARTRVMADQRSRHPDWRIVAYEDLARDTVSGFRSLYASLGLRWTAGVERFVTETTTTPDDGRYSIVRVSADHVDRWRTTMDDGDVARVRRMVEPFGLPWYRADQGAYV